MTTPAPTSEAYKQLPTTERIVKGNFQIINAAWKRYGKKLSETV